MTVINLTKIPIHTINLSPGSHLLMSDVTWEQYEMLLEDLGADRLIPRINYCNGTIEIMSPLPIHERPHRIIADIVKLLLDHQERDWEDFGSTTFKRQGKGGLEPDTCFYIQNAERVRGLMRIDLETDPPPDLAIEADVTSKTTLNAYITIQVPEVWIFEEGVLNINLLQNGTYQPSVQSLIFPDMAIATLIPTLVKQAFEQGTSRMLRNLRKQLDA